jgi:hypothetical protein
MDAAMTDTAPEVRGGFPEVKPVDAPPELGRFVAAMRRLQDLTVSTDPESAMWATAAGLSPSRTAYLHVDYRNITPIDEPLTAYGRIAEIDGRKAFVTATMIAADGTLLTEANGLMVRLLPHQP